ncbi:MAG TPA: nucleotide sugar dehydrogenase, partial [Mycobacteriales bacterium]|nr:nucleotide sugar dehydrogenase [Mycobacteriales bacterium]
MNEATERVLVVGLGYVGLPLAVGAWRAGYDVVGYDLDQSRVRRVMSGQSYVEDVASADLAVAVASGRLEATSREESLDAFDVAVIAVPTPLSDGNPDLRFVRRAADAVGRHIRAGVTVIVESTVCPGTTEELVAPILEDRSGLAAGTDFQLGYSPERIDPGNRVWHLANTPKLVSGVDEQSLKAVQQFYDRVVSKTVPVASPAVAELSKLIENTYRHVNIALANELAVVANDLGIDIWDALDAAATKPFGFMRFDPGPGVGGHCLPIDPTYLSWRVRRSVGTNFRFVELANDINDHMPDYVVRRLTRGLNARRKCLNGSRVLLLGFAYKKNTGDVRETPARRVAELLSSAGTHVTVADPCVPEGDCLGVERV